MKYIPADKLIAEIEKWSDGKLTLSLLTEIKDIVNSLQQEQPEVDLEKEVEHWRNMMPVIIGKKWLSRFARHFYELGLNARKEE